MLMHWEAVDGTATSNPKRTETSMVVGVSTGESDLVPDWVQRLLKRSI